MPERHVILVVDLAFGDCGKGTIVDFLARRHGVHTVVRFNGGPQAGHNVIAPDGRHHTFSQFGSGSFIPGVRTLLSRFMLVEPYALFNEAEHLHAIGVDDALARLYIDARCPVITPCHQAANRLRELARGPAAHGTCGMGVGEFMMDSIEHPELMLHAAELGDSQTIARKLRDIRDLKLAQCREMIPAALADSRGRFCAQTLLEPTWIEVAVRTYAELARQARIADEAAAADILRETGTTIFEGAQGVLLDEQYGFHPHTTWSTTTFANAESLLDEAGVACQRTRLGVLRTYFTRHGLGPLVTEDPSLDLPEPHNDAHGWQGRFRVGAFDAPAARYAIAAAGGIDLLAITHTDCIDPLPRQICTAYEIDGHPMSLAPRHPPDLAHQEHLTHTLARCRPVFTPIAPGVDALLDAVRATVFPTLAITSHGPTAQDKHTLRPDLI